MKKILFLGVGLLFLPCGATRGDGPSSSLDGTPNLKAAQPKELVDLQSKYENDVQDATKPIRERYQSDLKDLLQKELLNGNASGAFAVKMALLRADAAYPFTGTWAIRDDKGGFDQYTFHSNGMVVENYNGNKSEMHWKEDTNHRATLTNADGVFCLFHLNEAGQLIRSRSGSGDTPYELQDVLDP